MAGVLIREGKGTQRQRKGSHMKMETEIGQIQPQASKRLEPAGLEEIRKERSSLEPLDRARPC